MAPVPIGGLHHYIIGSLQIGWILDQGLIFVPDIPGKYDFALFSLFCHPDLYGRRSQKMPCIHKPDSNIVRHMHFFSIGDANKASNSAIGIVHII